MGLDTVELVMAVEEHFKIEIPDEIAATPETIGQLHNFIVSELLRMRLLRGIEAAVFSELRDIMANNALQRTCEDARR